MAAPRPTLAVWKLASCDGCQLTLLDCEDELLEVADAVDIAFFKEATRHEAAGPFDLSLIDGSVSTPHDRELIHHLRAVSRYMVTLGACATAGGIQALRNFADAGEMLAYVYATPSYIEALATSTAASEHVHVDFELRGCPPDKRQLLEVINAFLHGRSPNVPAQSVCVECKAKLQTCVLVAYGTPCLGPVTQAGCGALCPGHARGCYGCFGPQPTPNTPSLAGWFAGEAIPTSALSRLFRSFYGNAPAFRAESERLERGQP